MRPSLSGLVCGILEELRRDADARERLIKESREVLDRARRLVVLVHAGNLEECERLAEELRDAARRFASQARERPRLYYSGLVRDTLAEYVEALQFYAIKVRGAYLSPSELSDAPPESYVLGLLDAVGELRRALLEALRRGDVGEAERLLNYMEDIYSALSLWDVPDAVLPGYRRKCDVARQVVERSKSELIYVKSSLGVIRELAKRVGSEGP